MLMYLTFNVYLQKKKKERNSQKAFNEAEYYSWEEPKAAQRMWKRVEGITLHTPGEKKDVQVNKEYLYRFQKGGTNF